MSKKNKSRVRAKENFGKGLERMAGGALLGAVVGLPFGRPGLGASLGGAYGLGRHSMDMEKDSNFFAGIMSALQKVAELPTTPEGAVKVVDGVTRIFRKGHWMLPSSSVTLRSALHGPIARSRVERLK